MLGYFLMIGTRRSRMARSMRSQLTRTLDTVDQPAHPDRFRSVGSPPGDVEIVEAGQQPRQRLEGNLFARVRWILPDIAHRHFSAAKGRDDCADHFTVVSLTLSAGWDATDWYGVSKSCAVRFREWYFSTIRRASAPRRARRSALVSSARMVIPSSRVILEVNSNPVWPCRTVRVPPMRGDDDRLAVSHRLKDRNRYVLVRSTPTARPPSMPCG